MTRNIRFRARKTSDNEFIIGDLVHHLGFPKILDDVGNPVDIFPSTLQESTGLFDNHEREIFNGDCLDTKNSTMTIIVKVDWNQDDACYDVFYLSGTRYGRLNSKHAKRWSIVSTTSD